jgi:hypothetical protein
MRKLVLASLLATTALAVPKAHAVLQLALDVQGAVFTCADGQACDTNGATGIIQVNNQSINGVAINGSIQSADLTARILNTSSLSIINHSGASRTLDFAVSATDFVGPAVSFATASAATFQTANGSTLNVAFYDDPNNTQGANTPTNAPGDLIDSASHNVVGAADSFSHNNSGSLANPDTGAFSMTETVTALLVNGGQIINRGQTEIKDVTEPASLAMLGMGMLGLGMIRSRRRS